MKVLIQENDEDKDYVNDCGCIQVAKSVLLEFTHFDGGKLAIICVSGGKITCLFMIMVMLTLMIMVMMMMMTFIMMAVI